jgi:hypothetical protein
MYLENYKQSVQRLSPHKILAISKTPMSLCQCPTLHMLSYLYLPSLNPPRIRRRRRNTRTYGARTSLHLKTSCKATAAQDAADSAVLNCLRVGAAARVVVCAASDGSGGGLDAGDLRDVSWWERRV